MCKFIYISMIYFLQRGVFLTTTMHKYSRKTLISWVVWKLVRQLVYTMLIINNRASFHLVKRKIGKVLKW